MTGASTAGQNADHWESLPGWTPVYLGLGRFRTGLALRLVLVVIAPLATALAASHGPPPFLTAALILTPVLAAMTSLIMVSGLLVYAHPPVQVRAETVTRNARNAFTLLLALDLGHVVLATLVVLGAGETASLEWLRSFQLVGELVGLACLGLFMRSLGRIAEFVGALPALGRLRHLWMGLFALVPAVLVARLASAALAEVSTGVHLVASFAVLAGAVLLLAGVNQLVTSLRDNLLLTTSEFAAVSVTGERRALDA